MKSAKHAKPTKDAAPAIPRLVPTQKRSRERYEHILSTAATILAEKGSDAFKMSDIVERAGVPHGSLYQYFPDKIAVIATLAERSNLEGRACVKAELADVTSQRELHTALLSITDGYYRMFLDEPVLKDIWHATQGDHRLQQLDSEDMDALAGMLAEVIQRLKPDADRRNVFVVASLMMHLIAAAVRHAISIDPEAGKATLAAFKRVIPKTLAPLLDNG